MTDLVRTKGGKMVHTRGCRYAKTGVPWTWARNRTQIEVRLVTAFTGVHFCKRCKPLESLPQNKP